VVGVAATRFLATLPLLALVVKTAAVLERAQVVLEPLETRIPAAVAGEEGLAGQRREPAATAAAELSFSGGTLRRPSPLFRQDCHSQEPTQAQTQC
jgi:hypothetical protein